MPAFFNILIKKAGNLYQNFVLFVKPPPSLRDHPPQASPTKTIFSRGPIGAE